MKDLHHNGNIYFTRTQNESNKKSNFKAATKKGQVLNWSSYRLH